MFYQPEQYQQYQQEQEQRKELELLFKQQLLQQAIFSTPPPSPMTTALGHPNRSCVSCKKRKVKCDRKTPSCSACQKSKHRCHYTSYSPPVFTEELQQQRDEDEGIKAIKQKIEELDNTTRQRWEHVQRMYSNIKNVQPAIAAKEEFVNNSSSYYLEDDDTLFNMNLTNPMMPPTSAAQYPLPQGSPLQMSQQVAQLSPPQSHLSPQQVQIPAPYLLQQHYHHPTSTATSPYIQTENTVFHSENYSPYMRGTITLNYNLNGMRPLLGRQIVPILQAMTVGNGPIIPPTGFTDIGNLQAWLREKLSSQDWTEESEQDERFELRPIIEDVNQQSYSLRQRFEVILHRVEFASSPTSAHGDFHSYEFEEKPHIDMDNYTNYSETGSNRSSIIEIDPTDIFLNKVYSFVRRFIRNHSWLRENFLMNLRVRSPLMPMGFGTFNDGVFSDIAVEVRKTYSYTPYQDVKLISNNHHEEFVKGRLFF